jgi:putative ABC transport system permease protein
VNLFYSFQIAFRMLKLHKLRAFLTMLGVIIGVMSVTLITIVSNGFTAYIDQQFQRVGANTLFVTFDTSRLEPGETSGGLTGLTSDDLDFIMERSRSIAVGSGYLPVGARAGRAGEREWDKIDVQAVDSAFFEINRIEVNEGRRFTEDDDRRMANVALITQPLADQLFPGVNPLGRTISLDGITLEVIGITERNQAFGQRESEQLFLPISTAQKKWLGGDRLGIILLKPRDGVTPNAAMDEVWRMLMARSGNKAVYRLDSNESILAIFTGIVGVAGIVLAGIAALSLLVGGIGIMNIMLVSVTERTKEIGLRKSVGATKKAILSQFLVEAATLSMTGGLIGMAIAYGFGLLFSLFTVLRAWPNEGGLTTPFPLVEALFATAFSALIGMIFGFYPAVRAAQLSPIDALRHE